MMLVVQAYKFALDPTPRQHRALWSHCGAARFAYNWGLDLVRQRQDERAAGLIRKSTVSGQAAAPGGA
jgi:putative transposase